MEEGKNNFYDEDEALSFIKSKVGMLLTGKYDDELILTIMDLIWDYYERKGLLSIDFDAEEDDQMDIDELYSFVRKEIKKDEDITIDSKDLKMIINAELEYEDSLDDFI